MHATVSIPRYVKTHALAIASLVLAFTGFTFLLWIGCIFAEVTGSVVKKEIRAYPDQYAGENLAKTGVTL